MSTPRRARWIAVLRPSPRLAPVMIAVLSFPLLIISSLLAVLPGNDASRAREGPGWTIIREQRQANGLRRSFLNGLRPPMLVQIGCREAWFGRIHFDRRAAQFVRKLHGEHVESCLGCSVAEKLRSDMGPRR